MRSWWMPKSVHFLVAFCAAWQLSCTKGKGVSSKSVEIVNNSVRIPDDALSSISAAKAEAMMADVKYHFSFATPELAPTVKGLPPSWLASNIGSPDAAVVAPVLSFVSRNGRYNNLSVTVPFDASSIEGFDTSAIRVAVARGNKVLLHPVMSTSFGLAGPATQGSLKIRLKEKPEQLGIPGSPVAVSIVVMKSPNLFQQALRLFTCSDPNLCGDPGSTQTQTDSQTTPPCDPNTSGGTESSDGSDGGTVGDGEVSATMPNPCDDTTTAITDCP